MPSNLDADHDYTIELRLISWEGSEREENPRELRNISMNQLDTNTENFGGTQIREDESALRPV
jgi:hypothetical protein